MNMGLLASLRPLCGLVVICGQLACVLPEGAASPATQVRPRRIVSLSPALTEIVFALGAGDRVVGVTDYCTYPPRARSRPTVGGTTAQTMSLEAVLRLEPDLVLAGSFGQEDAIRALLRLGLRVSTHRPGSMDDTLKAILSIGKVVGNDQQARDLSASLEHELGELEGRVSRVAASARPRVFYLVWDDPLLTAGSETFIGELITRAGGQNIFAELKGDFPRVGLETVLRRQPEVIIIPSHHGGRADDARRRAARAGLGRLPSRTRFRVIDGDVVSRPGPRLADALGLFARGIHGSAWEGSGSALP